MLRVGCSFQTGPLVLWLVVSIEAHARNISYQDRLLNLMLMLMCFKVKEASRAMSYFEQKVKVLLGARGQLLSPEIAASHEFTSAPSYIHILTHHKHDLTYPHQSACNQSPLPTPPNSPIHQSKQQTPHIQVENPRNPNPISHTKCAKQAKLHHRSKSDAIRPYLSKKPSRFFSAGTFHSAASIVYDSSAH